MKKFFNDYFELCKASQNFYKEHMLGTVISSVTAGVATFLLMGGATAIKEISEERKELKQLEKGISSKQYPWKES